jgi:hypothetical protein
MYRKSRSAKSASRRDEDLSSYELDGGELSDSKSQSSSDSKGAKSASDRSGTSRYLDIDKSSTPGTVYVNVSCGIPNVDGLPNSIIAKTTQTANLPILDNPSDYKMAIIRFSAQTPLIPILVLSGYQAGLDSGAINKLNDSITFGFAGNFTAPVFLQWVPQTDAPPPAFITDSSGTIISPNPQNNQYFYLFSYQHWINIINTAFDSAFALATALPGWPAAATAAPRMVYDPATQLCTLLFETRYDYKNPAPIGTYFNLELFEYFQNSFDSFQNNYNARTPLADGTDVQLLVTDTTTNHITSPFVGYSMIQEFNTLALWPDVYKFVFLSSSIPVVKEYSQYTQNTKSTPLVPIVSDFIPVALTGPDIRTQIVYAPTAQYRYIDLIGTTPLYAIDLQMFWVDALNNWNPVFVPHYSTVDVKIAFVKKGKEEKK